MIERCRKKAVDIEYEAAGKLAGFSKSADEHDLRPAIKRFKFIDTDADGALQRRVAGSGRIALSSRRAGIACLPV